MTCSPHSQLDWESSKYNSLKINLGFPIKLGMRRSIKSTASYMHILLTNDDGYNAPGIKVLYKALEGLGELWIAAPVNEKSGVSHAFTIKDPLRVDLIEWMNDNHGYAVHGTPVDAVKLAIRSLMPEPPALVVSGINQGENTGVDLLYSGTVAAAMEGAILGIPSIAISLASKQYSDYSTSARFARNICKEVIERGLPAGVLLNTNIPPLPEERIAGVRITHQAESRYIEGVERRDDPNGGDCYWVEYEKVLVGDGNGSDVEAIKNNYISVTPVHSRFTQFDLLPEIKSWNLGCNNRQSTIDD